MGLNKLSLLKARLEGFQTTLRSADSKQKSEKISIQIAESFNKILTDIKTAYPEVSDDLPEPIELDSVWHHIGAVAATYLDLKIYAEQTRAILNVIDSGS